MLRAEVGREVLFELLDGGARTNAVFWITSSMAA
jgi:hypothetical protein